MLVWSQSAALFQPTSLWMEVEYFVLDKKSWHVLMKESHFSPPPAHNGPVMFLFYFLSPSFGDGCYKKTLMEEMWFQWLEINQVVGVKPPNTDWPCDFLRWRKVFGQGLKCVFSERPSAQSHISINCDKVPQNLNNSSFLPRRHLTIMFFPNRQIFY